MQKSRVLDLKNIKILNLIFSNRTSIVLGVLFFLGLIISSIIFGDNKTLFEFIKRYFEDFFEIRKTGFISIFFDSFKDLFLYLLLIYMSGTSALGVAVSPLLIFWCGFKYGSLISYIYSQYSIKGIAFNSVIIIPSAIICVIVFIFAARFSIEFSLDIARLTLPRATPNTLNYSFKLYATKYLILIIFLMLASVVDAALSSVLIDTFNF